MNSFQNTVKRALKTNKNLVKLQQTTHIGRLFKQIILVFFSLCLLQSELSAQNMGYNTNYKLKKVVIDAGHGGKDPGALGKISMEKNITLAISLKLGKLIEEAIPETEVVYTRTDDQFVELHRRAEIANSGKADLFISIHANANDNKNRRGTETYMMGVDAAGQNLEIAKLENSAIIYEDNYSAHYNNYNPTAPESIIVLSLLQDNYFEQSLYFATLIQKHCGVQAAKNNGVKQAGFIVLWNTVMPSVLIEVGYLSNLMDERYINSQTGQDFLAQAIFNAFKEYKLMVESKSEYTQTTQNQSRYGKSYETKNRNLRSTNDQNKDRKNTPENPIMETRNTTTTTNNNPINQISKTTTTNTASHKVWFEIQICSSDKQLSLTSSQFKGLTGVNEKKVDGVYKYTIGNEINYESVVKLKSEVQKKIPGAFIIAFKNNERIPVQEAILLIKN